MTKITIKKTGISINHGQMSIPSTSPLHPRNGAAKRQYIPAVVFGQRRASQGVLSPHIHGIALQDEPNIPFKSYEKPVEAHSGMTDRQKAKFDPKSAGEHLRAAGQLSRKE